MLHIRALVSIGAVMFAAICGPAHAATLTVTSLNDSGAGSLRDALASAAAGDTIVFGPGATGTIALASTLGVAQSVTIQGPGAANLVLDGQGAVQVIAISAGTLTLSGVTIASGSTAGLGGGISTAGGASLAVSNCVFTGNLAGNGGGISNANGGVLSVDACTFENNATTGVGGGAIINMGTATVSNSTFVGNTAPINGGAINVQASGTLTLTNSTFSGNSSISIGGALSSLGTVSIINSTFAANQGSSGSVLATSNSNVTLYNSVFTNNVATGGPGALSIGAASTTSNNVFFNNTAGGVADDLAGYGTSNFIAAAAEPLAPLANNGGPTLTMLPLAGQAAICAGSIALLPGGLTQDQRGFPRTTTYGSTPCVDAGAAQLQSAAVAGIPTLSASMLGLLAGLLAMFGMRGRRYPAR